MAYSFNRAVRAMIVTSSTTAVAFFANSLSEIVPIKCFGIYAAIIVPTNFILTSILIPPALYWWETKIKHRCSCSRCFPCCNRCKKKDFSPDIEEKKPQADDRSQEDCLTRCFGGRFNLIVYKLRIVLTIVLTLLGLSALGVAS